MADRDIFVVTPADNQDLLTLDECKTLLNISLADTSRDAQMKMQISIASAICAAEVNRKPELGFGETRVIEEFREVMGGRLFTMHWPISQNDPIVITANGNPFVKGTDYRVDFSSGKISIGSTWRQPAIVEYTGGYKLPDDAPMDLKQACALIVQDQRIRNQQASVAGMRQLRHKESQVSFYDPNALLLKTAGAKSPGMQAAESLLRPYLRLEV